MKVRVISPWYPDEVAVYSGVFVRDQVRAIESLGADVGVEVPVVYPAHAGQVTPDVVDSIRTLASRSPDNMYRTVGSVTWIPSPVPSRSGAVGRASAFRNSIRLKREYVPVEGDISHAHLGLPTGWALLGVGDRPLVVTEHQSTLSDVLESEEARKRYREVLVESAAFICVSQTLKDQLMASFGEAANRVLVIPNVVDLEGISFRERTENSFSAWIYVGGISSHKGVMKLLRAFAVYKASIDPDASLLMVGDGPLRNWVKNFAESHGLSDSVEMVGSKPRESLSSFLDRSDVMVHLSPYETFGLASLEAIGAGLPVVSLRNGGIESTWADHEASCGRILAEHIEPEEVAKGIVSLRDYGASLDAVKGRQMVEARFSPRSVGNQLMEVYKRCLRA